MSFFDDFDDLFSSVFNRFNRPVLDQKFHRVFKKPGKGYIVVFNTLGIKKEDVSVQIEQQKGRRFKTLHIKGQTEIPEIEFHNSVDMAISLNFEEEVKSVNYKVADGLLYVYLEIETPLEDKSIQAKYIDDNSAGLDW